MNIYLINPESGTIDMSENIRYFLARKKNYEYLVFDIQEDESEIDIIENMMNLFEDENIRFFVCGGSGTFSRAISALNEEDFKRVEVAYYPCGTLNDILKIFGSQAHYFYNMDNLIRGGFRYLDYIQSESKNSEKANFMIFSSIGYLATVENIANQLHFLANIGPKFVYLSAFYLALLVKYPINYHLVIDGTDYSGYYDSIYIGNGVCFGDCFRPFDNASPDDGKMEVMLVKRLPVRSVHKFIRCFRGSDEISEHFKNIRMLQAEEITIKRKDKRPISINVDGNCIKRNEWNLKVVNNSLRFVVPNGVEIDRVSKKRINPEG